LNTVLKAKDIKSNFETIEIAKFVQKENVLVTLSDAFYYMTNADLETEQTTEHKTDHIDV
ncbi:15102_t:CDS:2, partial [Dentiscutata erythropus]